MIDCNTIDVWLERRISLSDGTPCFSHLQVEVDLGEWRDMMADLPEFNGDTPELNDADLIELIADCYQTDTPGFNVISITEATEEGRPLWGAGTEGQE